MFVNYATLLESIGLSYADNSFVQTLPGIITRYSFARSNIIKMLDLSNEIYDPQSFDKFNPIAVYTWFLNLESFSQSLSTYINQSGQLMARLINLHSLSESMLQTKLKQVKDLIKVVSVYISTGNSKIIKYRVYPKSSDASNRGALPSHTQTATEIQTKAIKDISDGIDKARQLAREGINGIKKGIPKNGKLELEIENQTNELINGLKFDFGSSEGQDQQQNANIKINKIETNNKEKTSTLINNEKIALRDSQLSYGYISFPPVVTNKLRLQIEVPVNTTSVSMRTVAPMKLEYKGEGEIAEQEFKTPTPIQTISITDEDYQLSEEIKKYFIVRHEIKLDGIDEWIQIRPRNTDNYELNLPELISIGGTLNLPGIYNINTDKEITGFKYKSSFTKNGQIPQDVLIDLYTQKQNRIMSSVNNSMRTIQSIGNTIYLSDRPLSKPSAFITGQGIVTSNKRKAQLLGYNFDGNIIKFPEEFLTGIEDKTRFLLTDGNRIFTHVSTVTTTGQYKLLSDGTIETHINDKKGQPLYGSLKLYPANVDLDSSTTSSGRIKLDKYADFINGNLNLYYYDLPSSNTFIAILPNLPLVFPFIYSISLFQTNIEDVVLEANYDSTNITNNIFITPKTYQSGIENLAHGDYSIDYENGIVYVNISNSTYLDKDIKFTIQCKSSKQNLDTQWKYLEDKTIQLENVVLNQQALTIPPNTKSFSITLPSSKFKLIADSVNIPGYVNFPLSVKKSKKENIVIKQTSHTSGVSYFDLPYLPIDEEYSITVVHGQGLITTRGSSSNGQWDLTTDKKQIKVLDSTNIIDHIQISYTVTLSNNRDLTKTFYINLSNNSIVLNEATTEALSVSYLITSYAVEYNIVTKIPDHYVDFNSNDRGELKLTTDVLSLAKATNNSEYANQDILIHYEKLDNEVAKQFSSNISNTDPSRFLTLLPKHVDIEVQVS